MNSGMSIVKYHNRFLALRETSCWQNKKCEIFVALWLYIAILNPSSYLLISPDDCSNFDYTIAPLHVLTIR